jgi:hypothetical protein
VAVEPRRTTTRGGPAVTVTNPKRQRGRTAIDVCWRFALAGASGERAAGGDDSLQSVTGFERASFHDHRPWRLPTGGKLYETTSTRFEDFDPDMNIVIRR